MFQQRKRRKIAEGSIPDLVRLEGEQNGEAAVVTVEDGSANQGILPMELYLELFQRLSLIDHWTLSCSSRWLNTLTHHSDYYQNQVMILLDLDLTQFPQDHPFKQEDAQKAFKTFFDEVTQKIRLLTRFSGLDAKRTIAGGAQHLGDRFFIKEDYYKAVACYRLAFINDATNIENRVLLKECYKKLGFIDKAKTYADKLPVAEREVTIFPERYQSKEEVLQRLEICLQLTMLRLHLKLDTSCYEDIRSRLVDKLEGDVSRKPKIVAAVAHEIAYRGLDTIEGSISAIACSYLSLSYQDSPIFIDFVGSLYLKREKFPVISLYFFRELIGNKEIEKALLPDIYNSIGKIYRQLKKYPKAIESFEKALSASDKYSADILPQTNNFYRRDSWSGMGYAYFDMNNYKEASRSFSRGYIPAWFIHKDDLARVERTMGICYQELEEIDSALEYFQFAIDRARDEDMNEHLPWGMEFGAYCCQVKKFIEAQKAYQDVLKYHVEYGHPLEERDSEGNVIVIKAREQLAMIAKTLNSQRPRFVTMHSNFSRSFGSSAGSFARGSFFKSEKKEVSKDDDDRMDIEVDDDDLEESHPSSTGQFGKHFRQL